MKNFDQQVQKQLDDLTSQGLRRELRVLESVRGVEITVRGRSLINWATNDTLGLSQHPRLIEAAAAAAADWGVGARASRLLAGTTQWHQQLEEQLAGWFGAPAGLLFSSGYLANMGALTVLPGENSVVFVDRLAHASLIDALRSGPATIRVFPHQDYQRLEDLLKRAADSKRRAWVVTEGVFSMDGDASDVKTLVELTQRHDAQLYVDDAHGAFACGASGRGVCEELEEWPTNLILMVTLGKALGAQGGAVICNAGVRELLINRARTFIYETAPATPVVAAASAALKMPEELAVRRRQLAANIEELRGRLKGLVADSTTHIQPLILGANDRAERVAHRLWDSGIWCPAIRPPTVPKNTARLRISLSSDHQQRHMEALCSAIEEGWNHVP